jgi:hypothetical protein
MNKLAQWHVDKHVNKLILEAAQLLSCAASSVYNSRKPWTGYANFNVYLPLQKWVCASQENWLWTREYMYALKSEWNYRQNHSKCHASVNMVNTLQVPELPRIPLQPFYQAMPLCYKHENSITAYRNYYAMGKFHLHSWRKRKKPKWLDEHLRAMLLQNGTLLHAQEFKYYISLYPTDTQIKHLWYYLKES